MSITAILAIIILVLLGSVLGKASAVLSSIHRLLAMLSYADPKGDAFRLQNEPKSISGMTNLELPRIEKDFPEFHWPEWRQRSENILRMYLEAVEHKQASYLKDVGIGLYDELQLAIQENYEQDVEEKFDNLKYHQTEISKYERDKFICRVLVQMSVEYYHTLKGPRVEKPVNNEKEQHRYELEIVYVQDVTALGDTTLGYGVSCPHCGAPISNLGAKHCVYCGTAVEPINIRVWTPNKIKEI